MMKTFLTAVTFSLILSVAVAQQETFKIKGKIGSLSSPAKVYLEYQNGDLSVLDSAVLKNGKFTFKGRAEHATGGSLVLSHDGEVFNDARDFRVIFLQKGTIKIDAADSLANATVKGSELNADYQRLQASLRPMDDRAKAMYARYEAASEEERQSEAFQTERNNEYAAIREAQREKFLDFVNNNPQSIISVMALERYGGAEPDVNTVASIFAVLSESVRNSAQGKAYAQRLENIKRTEAGQPAPLFTQNDPEGNPISLEGFKGQYVLIDFWASWCGPCRAENPNVVKAYEAYKDKNFTILGVSLDDEKGREAWLKAIRDDQLTWTQVSDLKGWENDVATLYAVRAIPQNFLVDPAGNIIAKDLRGEELTKKLAELLD